MNSIDRSTEQLNDTPSHASDVHSDIVASARELRSDGFALVRISPATKRPIGAAWSTRSIEPEELQPGDMLGIQGGALSDGGYDNHSLVVIDLDSTAALEHAETHLPPTAMVEGRKGKPRSHHYYLVPNASIPEEWQSKAEQAAPAAISAKGHRGPRKHTYRDATTNKTAIDFIGTGGQAVCPPSLHSSGDCREWDGGKPGKPAIVEFPALLAAVEALAAAANCRSAKRVKAAERVAATTPTAPTAPTETPTVQPAAEWQWSPEQDVAEREYRNALAKAVRDDGLPRTGRGGDAWTYAKLCYGLTGFRLRPERVLAAFAEVVNLPLQSVADLIDPSKLVDDSWRLAELQRKLEIRVNEGPGTEYGSVRRHSANGTTTHGAEARGGGRLVIRSLADVKMQPIRWLVPKYIPAGKLVLFAGPGGVGKSTITLALASALSRGECAFNLSYPDPPRGKTLLVGCEDDPADTLKPRAIAMGADVANIGILEREVDADGKTRPFQLTDLTRLEERLSADSSIKLIVIDPITSFVGRANRDEHKAGEVRALLDPLADLAARFGVCILLVAHLNMNTKASAVDRVGGSGAFTTGVRVAYVFGRDPIAQDVTIFTPAKANILPNRKRGFAYRLEGIDAREVAQVLQAAGENPSADELAEYSEQMFRPTWLPQVDYTADQIVQPAAKERRDPRADEAASALLSLLDGHAWPDAEIRAALNAEGISTSAYNRAKYRLTKLPADNPQRISHRQRGSKKGLQWWFWKGKPDAPKPDRVTASQ